jgi:hypothetical protein
MNLVDLLAMCRSARLRYGFTVKVALLLVMLPEVAVMYVSEEGARLRPAVAARLAVFRSAASMG